MRVKPKRILRSKIVWLIIFLCSVFMVGWYGSSRPSNGTLRKDVSGKDVKQLLQQYALGKNNDDSNNLYTESAGAKPVELTTYDGQYFYLTYDKNQYKIKSQEQNKATTLEQVVLFYSAIANRYFSVTVNKSGATTIGDVTGVSFREANKDSYKKSMISIDGKEGVSYESTQDGYEKDAFFLENGLLTTIVFTSVSSDNLSSDFTNLTRDFHWKQ